MELQEKAVVKYAEMYTCRGQGRGWLALPTRETAKT